MTNPWNLYDSLIDAIPGHITVAAAYTGTKWCRVTSSESGAGMAFAMPVRTRPASYGEDDLAGLPLRDVAALAKSWNLAEAGLGMAAINAFHSLPKRAFDNGFAPCTENNWARAFHPYQQSIAGKKVAVIGHFPFASAALSNAAELFILERNPVEDDYPDSPILFDFGVDIITAFASDQPGMLDEGLQGNLLGGMYEAGMRVEKARP